MKNNIRLYNAFGVLPDWVVVFPGWHEPPWALLWHAFGVAGCAPAHRHEADVTKRRRSGNTTKNHSANREAV